MEMTPRVKPSSTWAQGDYTERGTLASWPAWKSESVTHLLVSDSLWPLELQPVRLLCLWNSSGKNIGEGCYFLLQGTFLTQELNLGLPDYRQTLYCLSHQESGEIEKMPFSSNQEIYDSGWRLLQLEWDRWRKYLWWKIWRWKLPLSA